MTYPDPDFDMALPATYPHPMKEIIRYGGCFVCGDQNKFGLQAKFFDNNGEAVTDVVASPAFEGYYGIYHGGVLASLLDEVMIKAILARGVFAVTAEMTVRFRRPVSIGEKLKITGRIVSRKGRVYATEGTAAGSDGTVFATAIGTYLEAREDLKSRLVRSLGK
ncbi:MAG: PaaI family thioesterase [Candidatus Zixiibacteriota bacterium]